VLQFVSVHSTSGNPSLPTVSFHRSNDELTHTYIKHMLGVNVNVNMNRETDRSAKLIIDMEGKSTWITNPENGVKKQFTFDYSYFSQDTSDQRYANQEDVFKDLGIGCLENAEKGVFFSSTFALLNHNDDDLRHIWHNINHIDDAAAADDDDDDDHPLWGTCRVQRVIVCIWTNWLWEVLFYGWVWRSWNHPSCV
jgi:hypothetical protein